MACFPLISASLNSPPKPSPRRTTGLQALPLSALLAPVSLRPCHSAAHTTTVSGSGSLEGGLGHLLGVRRGWGLFGNKQDCGYSQLQKATASAEKDSTLTEGGPSTSSSNVTSPRSPSCYHQQREEPSILSLRKQCPLGYLAGHVGAPCLGHGLSWTALASGSPSSLVWAVHML